MQFPIGDNFFRTTTKQGVEEIKKEKISLEKHVEDIKVKYNDVSENSGKFWIS